MKFVKRELKPLEEILFTTENVNKKTVRVITPITNYLNDLVVLYISKNDTDTTYTISDDGCTLNEFDMANKTYLIDEAKAIAKKNNVDCRNGVLSLSDVTVDDTLKVTHRILETIILIDGLLT